MFRHSVIYFGRNTLVYMFYNEADFLVWFSLSVFVPTASFLRGENFTFLPDRVVLFALDIH